MPYFVYIISCRGGSLYTGVAADWRKRLWEHQLRSPRAARYTRSHPMEALQALWELGDKGAALRLEHRIKQLGAEEKRRLIGRPSDCSLLMPGEEVRAVPSADWGDFSPEPDRNTGEGHC